MELSPSEPPAPWWPAPSLRVPWWRGPLSQALWWRVPPEPLSPVPALVGRRVPVRPALAQWPGLEPLPGAVLELRRALECRWGWARPAILEGSAALPLAPQERRPADPD